MLLFVKNPINSYVNLKLVLFIGMYTYESLAPFQFKHEFTMVVTGPSKSGKTEFVKQLVQNTQWISPPPPKIVWCYREWQKAYESLQVSVTFVKNIPSDDEKLVADLSTHHLLIFDDMMGGKAIESIVDWFTRKAHHRSTSVIYIRQNLFDRAAHHRTISLNAHYLVLFKNPRDKSQIGVLSRQSQMPHLLPAYEDATGQPHGYLLVDLSPQTPEELRLRSQLFTNLAVHMAPRV
jgi:hypothetical protein